MLLHDVTAGRRSRIGDDHQNLAVTLRGYAGVDAFAGVGDRQFRAKRSVGFFLAVELGLFQHAVGLEQQAIVGFASLPLLHQRADLPFDPGFSAGDGRLGHRGRVKIAAA